MCTGTELISSDATKSIRKATVHVIEQEVDNILIDIRGPKREVDDSKQWDRGKEKMASQITNPITHTYLLWLSFYWDSISSTNLLLRALLLHILQLRR